MSSDLDVQELEEDMRKAARTLPFFGMCMQIDVHLC